MNVFPILILLTSALLGGFLGLYLNKFQSKQYLNFILPFSGAFLLGIAVLHMLPEVFSGNDGTHSIGIFILIGFLIQIILEVLSKGVEHGHVHVHKDYKKGYLTTIMLGLCAHAFLEGMPLGNMALGHSEHVHSIFNHPYLWGIVMHKLPAATALSLLFLASNVSRKKMFLLLIVFAMMSPLGAIVTNTIGLADYFQKVVLAIAIGSILHVATIIIFETDENAHHHISYKKLAAILIGFSISMLSLL